MIALREKDFLQAVVQSFLAFGWLVYHTHDSRHSAKGFPDIVAILPPHIAFFELKAENGRLTRDQRQWQEAIAMAAEDGGAQLHWGVLRPRDRDEFERFLTTIHDDRCTHQVGARNVP